MKYFLLVVYDESDSDVSGPYESAAERDESARLHRDENPDDDDLLFRLDVDEHGNPEVYGFSPDELDYDDDEDDDYDDDDDDEVRRVDDDEDDR